MSPDVGQVVHSPERVELLVPIAGPTSRMLAFAVDWIVLVILKLAVWVGVFFGVQVVIDAIRGQVEQFLQRPGTLPAPTRGVLLMVAVVWLVHYALDLGYFVFLELATGGQSLGKRWLGLRVVQDGGFPITWRQSVVRNLLRAVDDLPGSYVVGLVAMLVSDRGRRLGDVAAGTLVVRLDRPPPAAPLPELTPEARGAFTFSHAQVARIGRTEVTLALETLRRIETLDTERSARVLERAAIALAARLEHPPVEPDERTAFLRAILDAAGMA